MAKHRRKGRVPAHLRPYLFKKGSHSSAPRRRRRSATMARHRRRHSSHSSGGAGVSLKDVLFSAGYGFVRSDVREFASPLIRMIPAGDYSDNLALGGAAYLAARFIKNPLVKQAAKTIVVNEAFLVGIKARAGASFTMTASSSSGSGLPVLA